ncbi:hypothetical protein KP509_04G000300 [Ceratopteris richardii]|nr:hypothetical protein KP509_04G000300 [Ceratopteris richardii]
MRREKRDAGNFMLSVCTMGCRNLTMLNEILPFLDECFSLPSFEELAQALQTCGEEGDRLRALQVHSRICEIGLETHPQIGSHLILMLVRVRSMPSAEHAFNRLLQKTESSWNSLITGYVNCGQVQHALDLYHKMQIDGRVQPSGHTFVAILRAYTMLRDLEGGLSIHAEVTRTESLECNLYIGNALIGMYAKCRSLERAQKVFDNLFVRDVVSWNAMLGGYIEDGLFEEAAHITEKMRKEGVSPSVITFVSSLKACGNIKATSKTYELHIDIEKKGFLLLNILLGTVVVETYAKCGLLDSAQSVFYNLPIRDPVSWTTLIAGFLEQGYAEEAVNIFDKMQFEGVLPDMVAFLLGLKACTAIGATETGINIHVEIERQGLLEKDCSLGTALVDMYGKCGLPSKAQQVFDRLQGWDVVTCNALMTGYAQLGQSENVSSVLAKMLQINVNPDSVTFTVILSACNRRGLYHISESFFNAMSKDHGIAPSFDHLACMIDLFNRTGHLKRADEMIKKLQASPNIVIWRSILAACKNLGIQDFGQDAFEHAVHLNRMDGSSYMLMSQLHALSGS